MDQNQLLLCFYGDDFTGSTDSMEALTVNGIRTVLFLSVPTPELIKTRFPDIGCFGVAGVSRSMTVSEMEEQFKPILQELKSFGTPIVHYKTCSTFDSSPAVGSIGKVIDISKEIFADQDFIPLLVAAPILKRYTLFGNLFAGVGEETFRLDRHPTMSKHPITPMHESDLRVHLGLQTESRISLMDILDLTGDSVSVEARYKKKSDEKPDVILFDVLDNDHLLKAGRLIWAGAWEGQRFVVGSSGVEYALSAYWKHADIISSNPTTLTSPGKVDQLIVVSGSCSPITMKQIEWALNNGFIGIKIPSETLIDPDQRDVVFEKIYREALDILQTGKSLVIYSAYGPDDPSIEGTKELLRSLGLNRSDTGKLIGRQLGQLLRKVLENTGLQRVLIAGGDTSGYATQELDIYGLEMIAPIEPGAPLCRAYSDNSALDGLEIVLKGGQAGKTDYFRTVRDA